MKVFYCDLLKSYSEPGEDETTFRNRIATDLREARDGEMMQLRQKYAAKQMTLNRQITTAQNAVSRESSQASESLISAGLSIGGALLSAFTGRKVLSASNIRKATTAFNRASKIGKERNDVSAAQQKLSLLETQLSDIQTQLKTELDTLKTTYDPASVALTKKAIDVKSSDINILFVALAYQALTA